jgi:hypothetical protein
MASPFDLNQRYQKAVAAPFRGSFKFELFLEPERND